jgi:hypothetical protein
MRDGDVEAMLAKLDAIIALLKELCALARAGEGERDADLAA